MNKKLTVSQFKALRVLSLHDYLTSASLGMEMTNGVKRDGGPMKAQGLGRLGGTMGTRLVLMGLAWNSHRAGGYPAYEISSKGRRVLEEEERSS